MTESNIKNRRAQRDPAEAQRWLKARYAAEARFQWYGRIALSIGALSLLILLTDIFSSGFTAFVRTEVKLEVALNAEDLGLSNNPTTEELNRADYFTPLTMALREAYPEVDRRSFRQLRALISPAANFEIRDQVLEDPSRIGGTSTFWVSVSSDLDQMHKGNADRTLPEDRRRLNDQQLEWYDQWVAEGNLRTVFNAYFFTNADSRNPDQAGIGGAVIGSIFTLLICLSIAFPMGVAAAIYLEEFAPKNQFTELIEVNINNLAAVPSIIFGLLGLAIVLQVFGIPRGTPVAGGIVLALMTLPTIIISCRAALKAVPPSIRQGAMGLGASPMQVVLHHVMPLAMPGTLTGTIIGLAQALGETAPLLMIGMVAFIADAPSTPLDPSAVMPVQIYLWAESAEQGFVEKTAAAIMLILAFLITMNAGAVYLRKKFERKW
jgi:phosphate transport system permease protein